MQIDTTLAKTIRDVLRTDPLRAAASLEVDELVVAKKLTVKGSSEFSDTGWKVIGGAGHPALQSPWSNLGGGNAVAAYKVLPGNLVVVKGLLTASVAPTSGAAIWTFPPGHRPAENALFHTDTENAGYARVDVDSTGALTWIWTGGGGTPNSTTGGGYLSLNGIHFIAEH